MAVLIMHRRPTRRVTSAQHVLLSFVHMMDYRSIYIIHMSTVEYINIEQARWVSIALASGDRLGSFQASLSVTAGT